MKLSQFDWKNGSVDYWDLDEFDPDTEVQHQTGILKEDLAQVRYPRDIVLDVGWYPSFSNDGQFRIVVVHREDWESPLFLATTKEPSQLAEKLKQAIEFASSHVSSGQ